MARNISLHKTTLCGSRISNEDVEKYNMNLSINGTCFNPNYAPVDLFIICDGHGGNEVATFVVPELEKMLINKNLIYPLKRPYILKIYNYIQDKLKNHPNNIAKKCGCTSLVVIRYLDVTNKHCLQVINSGDCRVVVSRRGFAIPLSKDHKPHWSEEKMRIDEVNKQYGTNKLVHFNAGDWRIGDLSVSRSFGDLDNTPYVSHLPEIFNYMLMAGDEFIVLACDGIWDVLENHEVINFVRDHLYDNHTYMYHQHETSGSKNIARLLADYALSKGSMDNISVMIVFFEKKV